jgi:hypothetical protein
LGRAIEAQLKLNPAFKVTAGRASDEDGVGSEFGLEVEQPFRPSDFGLRKTYAAALRVAANLEQQADVLRVLNGTAVTFYRAWSLQERADLLVLRADRQTRRSRPPSSRSQQGSSTSPALAFSKQKARDSQRSCWR